MPRRPEFVIVYHPDAASPGRVSKSSLPAWEALGWKTEADSAEKHVEVEVKPKKVKTVPEWTTTGVSEQEDDTSAADQKDET